MRRPKPKARPPTRKRYVLNEQVGFLLRVAMQRYTTIFAARMVEELTLPQFAALAKLLEAGSCSQNQLGRLIYIDAATIKGVVDRLCARGLVVTSGNANDRRLRTVTLTPAGRRVAEAAIAVAAQITAQTLAPLSLQKQRVVVRLLKKLG